jgi:hypothetical protein
MTKKIINRVKRQSTHWDKIFTNYSSFVYYSEHKSSLKNLKISKPIKMGKLSE